MKKCVVVLAVAGVFVLSFIAMVSALDLAWQDIGRGNMNVRAVLVSPDNSSIIYIGSGRGILKSEDGGESWRNILSVRGTNKEPNFLLFASGDSNSLYAATGNGLYFSSDRGKNWSRLFKGKNYFENECTALAILPSSLYLGTKAGLFVSLDKGRSWHKETAQLGRSHILAIAYNPKEPGYIYVASADGVFKTADNGQNWERIFLAHPVEDGDDDIGEVPEDQDEEKRSSEIAYISLDANNLNYLYLGTSRGVYKSQDKGKSWELLPDYGLLDRKVKFLLVSLDSALYAVTKSGIFRYGHERWEELSLGLTAQDTRAIYLDRQGNLYAACDKGLFKASIVGDSTSGKDGPISLYYKDEPQIKAVQDAAIKYAEVEPEKISRWRKQASQRAFLPKVSAGVNRDTSDLWHWEGGSSTKAGDDVLVRGRETVGWDVTLSWELGDLIWSDDQTNIDVRSRLMVELRDDILDEVTKLYFERLRVKMELDTLSIEDRKKRFEKELKLGELTASLDALTGGYFSRQINGARPG